MKKRILALLLSLSLMVSVVVPGTVAMDGGDTVNDTYTELAVNGRETLHASQFGISAEPYQWQISIGGTWINISGETSDSITVSYAMLCNALSGDTAQVRCVGYDSEGMLIESDAMTIRITEEVAPTPVEQEETHPAGTVLEQAKPLGDPIIEKIKGESENIKDQIKEKFDEFKDNAKDALDQIKDSAKEKLEELKNKIDEKNDPEPIDQTEETSAETTAPAETSAEPASTDDSAAADDSVVTGGSETTNVETDTAPTTDEDAGDDDVSDQTEMTETTGEAEPENPADSEDKTPAAEEPADTTTEQEVTTSAPETEAPVTEAPETDAPVATEPSEGSDEDETEDIVISAPSFASPLTDEEPSAENKENDTQTPPPAPAEQTPPTAPSDPVTTAAPEKQEEQTGNTENTDENQKTPENTEQKDVPSDEQNNVPTVTDYANAVPASDPAPAGETPEPSTYTILINYQFTDGKQAAPSWSATVATGSNYTQDIQSPVVVGYAPSEAIVHVNTSEAKTYTVTYQPAEVEFTVKHYQQNVSNDQYTLVDTETKTGYTENAVGDKLEKTYTGFYSLLYDTTTKIAADGSTVVEIYYDRYYYLMTFDLDGGYGVEPIYARYGADISLKFFNHTKELTDKERTVKYEAPLKDYYFVPDYPSDLEPNAYVFAGWYTTAGCYDGSEANLNTMTMPASDVILYAKWTPKTHIVRTYKTENGDLINTWENVPHRSTIEKPEDPTNGEYIFVGWFYKEDGVEKAFDFSMPVTKDLDLYAKWSSNKLVEYTIKYILADGTKIADETKGSALAGATKTFSAKGGDELYNGYQTGYFPQTNSHSLTMDINGKNEFEFVYVPMSEVDFTVRYLEKGTEKVLHEEKTGKTSNAVITENFVPVTGYRPDAYQKRLVLSANETENVLTFWYEVDNEHAPVVINHWIQNIAGNNYDKKYQTSENLDGVIGNTYTENPLIIPGFEYNEGKSNPSGKLTAEGLVLNLYYDRNEYSYEFRFYKQGTTEEVAPTIKGNARYQYQITQAALTIPGYKLISDDSQTIKIAIEEPADVAKNNVRIFYYKYDLTSLTITKTGWDSIDENQSFIFKVTGKGLPAEGLKVVINFNKQESVTIAGLSVGETYTVTEESGWSWRYSAGTGSKILEADATQNVITINNDRNKNQWLNGCAYKSNIFGKNN